MQYKNQKKTRLGNQMEKKLQHIVWVFYPQFFINKTKN